MCVVTSANATVDTGETLSTDMAVQNEQVLDFLFDDRDGILNSGPTLKQDATMSLVRKM